MPAKRCSAATTAQVSSARSRAHADRGRCRRAAASVPPGTMTTDAAAGHRSAGRRARAHAPRSSSASVRRLGRAPNLVELGVFSVMWSEHCSYKSSRARAARAADDAARASCRARARTPARSTSATASRWSSRSRATTIRRSSSRTRARRPASAASCATSSPWARGRSPTSTRCASAASIIRARATWSAASSRGIGGYGNCVGVPTVGGEVYFDPGYNENILVNAFTLGVVRADRIFRASAAGRRQPGHLRRLEDRPRRHPRRQPAGLGRVRRRDRSRSARPCRSAIRSPRSCCSRRASS